MESGGTRYWVYVLENAEGRFYIGSTSDLQRRLAEHNDSARPRSHFTTKHGPRRLVWQASFPTRAEAMRREQQIKRMKSARWIREHLLCR